MQELFKSLISSVSEAGLSATVYNNVNSCANFIAIIFGILHGRKLKVKIIPIVVSIAVERALVGPLMTVILFVENGFSATMQQNGVVVFAFVPLLGFILSKVLKRSYKELWDVMMVVPIAMFAGARIACTITGCCYGYICSWGIYNAQKREFLFPIQLLESLVAILILVYVFWREKKNNFVPDGRNVPIILISYGISRFFLEFLHDNEKIFFGLASMQFHCILMILVGIITLKIIQKSENVGLSQLTKVLPD